MKEIGEGSLHPRPEGRGIRDPPHSHCNKSVVQGMPQAPKVDAAEQLKILAELKSLGIITEEEFNEKKIKLLEKL